MMDERPRASHPAPTPGRRVDLHIEQLVLHGFPASDRQRIGNALQRELQRLVAEQGLPRAIGSDSTIARLDAGAFDVVPHATAETIGAQVARVLYQGLGR